MLAILPFAADTSDPMMLEYRNRFRDQLTADARADHTWDSVTDSTRLATHVLAGSLYRS